MKIFLFGYGQMGREIEKLAVSRGHEITWIVDPDSANSFNEDELKKSDIAIEFSIPESATENIIRCFEAGIPVVVGTTGWYDNFELVNEKCNLHNGTLFYATNFSIGVNILFKVNELLSKLMNNQPDYDVSVSEIHHTKKKDAPSGTAVTLGKKIINNIDNLESWITLKAGKEITRENRIFPIFYNRVEGAVGEHLVKYKSNIDEINIRHKAFSREGFTLGTLLATEWVAKKKGVYTMSSMLKI